MVGGALDAGGWKWRAAWAGVLVLAAANFFAGLGSSSLFVDESISWELARAPIGDLLRSVREIEVTPPTYHLFLHEWLWRGGGGEAPGEAFMRLPSALAGVALVGVTGWLGTVVADRRAGLVAAALAAASPLVLAYAQQVRVYAFAMLLCAVCAAAAIELSRADRARAGRRRLWLALALASAAGALWLHYLSLLAIGPIVLWAATRPGLPARERAVLTGGTALAFAVTVPLLLDQSGRGHQEALELPARLSCENLLQVLANPFDGRHNEFDLALIPTLAGALALAVAVAVVARDRRADPSLRGLVLPLGALAAVPLVLYTLVSSNVMLTRYTAVAAPFALVVIGAAIATARARLAVPVALLAAASALYGSLASHRESGRFPDIRSAVQTIADDPRDATTTALAGYPAIGFTYEYYAQRAGLTSVRPERRFPIPGARRTWALSMPAMPRQTVRSTLAASGYRLLAHETFPAGDTVQLALVERSR